MAIQLGEAEDKHGWMRRARREWMRMRARQRGLRARGATPNRWTRERARQKALYTGSIFIYGDSRKGVAR